MKTIYLFIIFLIGSTSCSQKMRCSSCPEHGHGECPFNPNDCCHGNTSWVDPFINELDKKIKKKYWQIKYNMVVYIHIKNWEPNSSK